MGAAHAVAAAWRRHKLIDRCAGCALGPIHLHAGLPFEECPALTWHPAQFVPSRCCGAGCAALPDRSNTSASRGRARVCQGPAAGSPGCATRQQEPSGGLGCSGSMITGCCAAAKAPIRPPAAGCGLHRIMLHGRFARAARAAANRSTPIAPWSTSGACKGARQGPAPPQAAWVNRSTGPAPLCS